MSSTTQKAFLRTEEAPRLPPPVGTVGLRGWVKDNLFYNIWSTAVTIFLVIAVAYLLNILVSWAFLDATWSGQDGEACRKNIGACWPFVSAKFGQWIFGFYPVDQRWRVMMLFITGGIALACLLIPSIPYKKFNVFFLLAIYPVFSLIMLTGGNFNISPTTFIILGGIMLACTFFLPPATYGAEQAIRKNRLGAALILLGALPMIIMFFVAIIIAVMGILAVVVNAIVADNFLSRLLSAGLEQLVTFETFVASLPYLQYCSLILLVTGAALSIFITLAAGTRGRIPLLMWLVVFGYIGFVLFLVNVNFGLEPVETSKWGGLLVTLIVAVTGIVFSLPLGILLALGRRSHMAVIKYFSIGFIETLRGLPLITVLFMASVLLPLFLPPGTYFDKLVRALVAVALFSAAYMAEVIRGGLQAIPKGQVEAAQAMGLTYWQTMGLIVMPQALTIVIPGIVNTFISLFQDTTLVVVVGIFDLTQSVIAGFSDPKWASPQTGKTGYFVVALIYLIFCLSMSRYSQFIERRLDTGHKR